jgi:hypothetical protein
MEGNKKREDLSICLFNLIILFFGTCISNIDRIAKMTSYPALKSLSIVRGRAVNKLMLKGERFVAPGSTQLCERLYG